MEKIILTKKNCHRAAQVRLIEAPETGVYAWGFREIKNNNGMFSRSFAHAAKQGEDTIQVRDVDIELNKWEVVSWKYETNFEDLWDKAVRAFENTSFSPEERAALYIRQYEDLLLKDLSKLPEEEHKEYTEKFRTWVVTLFDKHSRILSAMITGPARFPTSRNEKANKSYDKAMSEFSEWREKYARRVAKRIEDAKSPEEKESMEWLMLKRDIDHNAKACADVDNGEPYYRSAFTNSIFGKVERLANNGKAALVLKALDYIKQVQENEKTGLKKPLFTSRHKIWKLQEVCEKAVQRQEERANAESIEIEFDGGKVVKNFADDRLQIFHDEKPNADVISRLKSNGFRWSRFNGCWQRQLTDNSYYGAARVLFGNDVLNEERNEFIGKLRNA